MAFSGPYLMLNGSCINILRNIAPGRNLKPNVDGKVMDGNMKET